MITVFTFIFVTLPRWISDWRWNRNATCIDPTRFR
jgi:hypothetical protein